MKSRLLVIIPIAAAAILSWPVGARAQDTDAIPSFDQLVAHRVALKPELVGVHPRVFVTASELTTLRTRARTTHKAEWTRALSRLVSLTEAVPPAPGPQERRSQNTVGLQIAGTAFAYAIEQDPKYLTAAKAWMLAAIDYEPWGYTYDKPNTDLAAGHLLYALGWAYDLLYDALTPQERSRIRRSLERHADLVYDAFAPKPGKQFAFTQNHNFIPTAGLGVAALALMGESPNAGKWAAVARAHHHRAGQLLSPDGFYYERMEYWIFSPTWLVHFMDALEHSTGESLWDRPQFRNWKYMIAHIVMPDGHGVFDFGDIYQGPETRARRGPDYARVYPNDQWESNFNVLYRVAAKFRDPQAQAVADRCANFGHTNQEEWWTLLWRDAQLAAAPMSEIPLAHHFEDVGVAFYRTSWDRTATAFALKAGPPEGHRVTKIVDTIPEWRLSSGHAHPDAGSFIIFANGHYLTGDTGYAGQIGSRHHNTITVDGTGQGKEGQHDVWGSVDPSALDAVRLTVLPVNGGTVRIEAEASAAYPSSVGLTRFHRVFTFDGAREFTVEDTVVTTAPRKVQWYLQSDLPVEKSGDRFLVGGASPALAVTVAGLAGSTTTCDKTMLIGPGRPGSVSAGAEEQRGHHLMLETPAATTRTIRAVLVVVPRT